MIVNLFKNSEELKTVEAGQVIFSAGEPGELMYIVVEGEVEIMVGSRAVDTASAGSTVGEMALVERTARSATAIARTECKLMPINEKRFMFLVQQTPYFAIQVMQIMSERLRKMNASA